MTDAEQVMCELEHEIARADIADLDWIDCVEVNLLRNALALLKAQEPIEARLNLCESCTKEYAECKADKTDLVYGSGVGNDNIIGCSWYVNRWKAQEPRVMTLEEVKSAWRNRDIAFLVEYNDGGNPVWMLYYGYLSTLEEIVLIDEIAHLRHFGVGGYGVDWRCWTSRPTDEQRGATPWN